MLLRNARVDGALVDIAIEEGLIVAHTAGEQIDLEGRWVVPGLWDEHVHFSQWALSRRRLDISAAGSAAEAATLIGAAISTELVVAVGFRDGLWPDEPTYAVLDAVSGDVPVVALSGDLHCVWLNSAALRQFGHEGHATGLLREQPAFAITAALGAVADEQLDRYAAEAAAVAASRGVVGIVDLEMARNHASWTRRFSAGFDGLRVEFGIYREHLDEARALGLRTGDRLNELLTVGRLKVLTDGSLNTRTAYCADPFENGSHGLLEVSPDELEATLRTAVADGLELSVHAIGDAANTVALDAFEATGAHGRIEHAQFVAASDFARFAQLGIVASVQPEHAMDDRDVADRYWAGRTDRAYAWKSLLDAGTTLAFGSDAPVAPLDPWVAMAAAVDRTREGREPWHAEQRLSVADALAASTRSTLAIGQPADLVVVDRNPALGNLRNMPVHATYLAGRRTF